MTGSIPFENIIKDATVILRITKGDLPTITDNARMSLIKALCSLMTACWSVNPQNRPSAEDCQKTINWMVSNADLRTMTCKIDHVRYSQW